MPKGRLLEAFAGGRGHVPVRHDGLLAGRRRPGLGAQPRRHRPDPVPPARRAAARRPGGSGPGADAFAADRPPARPHAAGPGRGPADPQRRRPRAWWPCSTPASPPPATAGTWCAPCPRCAAPRIPRRPAPRCGSSETGPGRPPGWPCPGPAHAGHGAAARLAAGSAEAGPARASPAAGPRCCSARSPPCSWPPCWPEPEPGSFLGYVQADRRGGDGRRAGRLVRGGGDLPAPAGPADPAHGDHPRAQGAVRRDARRASSSRASSRPTRSPSGCAAADVGGRVAALAGRAGQRRPRGRAHRRRRRAGRRPAARRGRAARPSTASSASASSRRPWRRWPVGPSRSITRDGRHDELVDAALGGLAHYLDEHRDELHDRFEAKAAVVAARRRRGPHLRAPPRRRPRRARRHGPGPAATTCGGCSTSASTSWPRTCRPHPSCGPGATAWPTTSSSSRSCARGSAGLWAEAKATLPGPGRRSRLDAAPAAGHGHRGRRVSGCSTSRRWPAKVQAGAEAGGALRGGPLRGRDHRSW